MKGINTSSSDFADLRKGNVIYVDKTAYMHRMISDEEKKVPFISRSRRFGKSLTISALKHLLKGRRSLFKGLAIDKSDWKWRTHPVIRFRFNELRTESVEALKKGFVPHVKGSLVAAGRLYDDSVPYSNNNAIRAEVSE